MAGGSALGACRSTVVYHRHLEPRHQRARHHAQWGQPNVSISMMQSLCAIAAGFLCHDRPNWHRKRHPGPHPGQGLPALLLNQGDRQGHGIGARQGLRFRAAVGWPYRHRERRGTSYDRGALFSSRQRAFQVGQSPTRRLLQLEATGVVISRMLRRTIDGGLGSVASDQPSGAYVRMTPDRVGFIASRITIGFPTSARTKDATAGVHCRGWQRGGVAAGGAGAAAGTAGDRLSERPDDAD